MGIREARDKDAPSQRNVFVAWVQLLAHVSGAADRSNLFVADNQRFSQRLLGIERVDWSTMNQNVRHKLTKANNGPAALTALLPAVGRCK